MRVQITPRLAVIDFFYYCHPSGISELVSHYGFDLHFPVAEDAFPVLISHLFVYLLWHPVVLTQGIFHCSSRQQTLAHLSFGLE